MARYDFSAQRLYVDADLAEGGAVPCSAEQSNYLRNVLRLKGGDPILVFNGRDGEWRAELAEALPFLEWVSRRAKPSGVLAEQVHPHTGQSLSVSPLTWSHAAYITTVLEYVDKFKGHDPS